MNGLDPLEVENVDIVLRLDKTNRVQKRQRSEEKVDSETPAVEMEGIELEDQEIEVEITIENDRYTQ